MVNRTVNCARTRHLRSSERGDSIISFAIALPVVLLIILIMLDVAHFTTVKGMLTKACNRGATIGTALVPEKSGGAIDEKNVWYNLPPGPTPPYPTAQEMAGSFYTVWRGEACVRNGILHENCPQNDPFSSYVELYSMAAASQYLNEADNQLLIPMRNICGNVSCSPDCPSGRNCAWAAPLSFPLTEKTGTLELECGMSISLFTSPILSLFSKNTSSGFGSARRTEMKVVASRTFAK